MPYLETFQGDPETSLCIRKAEIRVAVKEALSLGVLVEVRNSSFTDPGPDYSEIVIAGVTVPGSRIYGY